MACCLHGILVFQRVLEVDNAAVVQLLNGTGQDVHHEVVRALRELLERSWEMRVQYVYREGNMVGNCMAAPARGKGKGMQLHQSPPTQAMGLLQADERRRCLVEANEV
ncbi:hypothetical protein J1N35_001005 [Gossypium stocksii]|uniref:RNase H type-1 domain-containing protein n=1 Tax=Gossypium stocksii TaxID=47602 RepID=A0A9D3WGU5_9ROSI|nr:hypothetical protein J1N35_001005 [Gossypium stocksii]